MSKKIDGRGRPRKELKLPNGTRFTITDLFAANKGHIDCRLTVYTRVGELVKSKTLKKTRLTRKTGSVGKPGTIFYRMSAWNRNQSRKLAKLNSAPAVDLTPAPVAPVAPLAVA